MHRPFQNRVPPRLSPVRAAFRCLLRLARRLRQAAGVPGPPGGSHWRGTPGPDDPRPQQRRRHLARHLRALQDAKVQCHLVQLPGFAGLPAVKAGQLADDGFLDGMRDRLLAYVEARQLTRPIVMGHSLGGVVALQMAIEQPDCAWRTRDRGLAALLRHVQNPAATEAWRDRWPRACASRCRRRMTRATARASRTRSRAWRMVTSASTPCAHGAKPVTAPRPAHAMYEMMTTDLRPQLTQMNAPTLVLGSWAGLRALRRDQGVDDAIFRSQYAKLEGVRIELSDTGYHFLMWDDPQWLQSQVRGFIGSPPWRRSRPRLQPGGRHDASAVAMNGPCFPAHDC